MVLTISAAVALYLFAGSCLSLVVIFYRVQAHLDRHYSAGWTWMGVLILVSLLAFASASLLCHYRHSRRTGSTQFRLALSMGFVVLALCCLRGEVMIRVLAEETPEGPLLGNNVLLPRDWARVLAHRRALWEQAS